MSTTNFVTHIDTFVELIFNDMGFITNTIIVIFNLFISKFLKTFVGDFIQNNMSHILVVLLFLIQIKFYTISAYISISILVNKDL